MTSVPASPANPLRAASNVGIAGEQVVHEAASAPVATPVASDARSNSNAPASQTAGASTRAPAPESPSKARSATHVASNGDIVLFEDKKPVRSDESPVGRTTRHTAATRSGTSLPVVIAEDVATASLLQRVEPEYPRAAREKRVQGSVVLNVIVSKDGSVEQLVPVTGDSELAPAAAAAVRQWRFKPLVRDGKPIEFESPITLNFALP